MSKQLPTELLFKRECGKNSTSKILGKFLEQTEPAYERENPRFHLVSVGLLLDNAYGI